MVLTVTVASSKQGELYQVSQVSSSALLNSSGKVKNNVISDKNIFIVVELSDSNYLETQQKYDLLDYRVERKDKVLTSQ